MPSRRKTLSYDELSGLHECVLNRQDGKGESLDAAIEAVIGSGRGPAFTALRNFILGIGPRAPKGGR